MNFLRKYFYLEYHGSNDGGFFLADSEGFQQSVSALAAKVRGRLNQPNTKFENSM